MNEKMKFVNPFLKPTRSVARKKTSGGWKKMPKSGLSFRNGRTDMLLPMLLLLLLVVLCGMLGIPDCQAFQLATTTTAVRQQVGRMRSKRSRCFATESSSSSSQSSSPTATATLGLLSFDLDDTLFPTNEVVNDANEVMVHKMRQLGFPNTTLSTFLDTSRAIRQMLKGRPITYSDLRKQAIAREMGKHLLQDSSNDSHPKDEDLQALVDECFQAWLDERHAAAERYLFADALESLIRLRQTFPDICIGAITNGRGNPLLMKDTLEPYFDFCVSGEDENVFPYRKPHAGIYQATLRRYEELYPHHHEQQQANRIWCHVGDCLANDVGASATLGAQAIWYCPDPNIQSADEIVKRLLSSSSSLNQQPAWSTATQRDRDTSAQLTQQAADKIAARVFNLSELPATLEEIVAKANVKQILSSNIL